MLLPSFLTFFVIYAFYDAVLILELRRICSIRQIHSHNCFICNLLRLGLSGEHLHVILQIDDGVFDGGCNFFFKRVLVLFHHLLYFVGRVLRLCKRIYQHLAGLSIVFLVVFFVVFVEELHKRRNARLVRLLVWIICYLSLLVFFFLHFRHLVEYVIGRMLKLALYFRLSDDA